MPTVGALVSPFIDAAIMGLALIAFTRLSGLRSFSKMSGYDFAITVAMGSVLASVVVSKSTGPLAGIAALAALFVVQAGLSHLRVRSRDAQDAMDNAPLLIMQGREVLEDNLSAAKMTRADLMGKLREANVTHLDQVRAVVFEQTGDVSVLHGPAGGGLEDDLLDGVRDAV
ncbi:DUF421 domain-containing protein [Sulfitobacter sabulilitoris]|uniref:DUF421 domain-containing protein n=1 Tax=Sulfitobacter sabulilitoris TaxID=2562655 RepID=A0A5S3PJJ9_9RHOB|nr:YetF domain-containing protein [Sulfitobacter sabulilitoris]TMM54436.1 DUF421 domain-containing protein [Sulfitobacter sabulilitoris]